MSCRNVCVAAVIFFVCVSSTDGFYLGNKGKEGYTLGRYSVWYHRMKRSADEETATGNHTNDDPSHSSHPDRYQIATINWSRVENPFIVCIWILFAGLAKVGFRSQYMHKVVSRVPESCLLICLGLVVGGIAYAINPQHQIDKLLFNPDTFFLFILPPIVLEAGYFMPKEPFFDNLGSILVYAIAGTLFNAFAIGLSLFGVYSANCMPGMTELTLLQCLLFGSIISAVDPVAVISVFEEIHVNIVLYICVFGESLLNDGVAVVLYHLFEQYIELPEILAIDYVAAFFSFFVVVLGGLIIGIIYGFFGSFITKYTVNNRVIEPTFVFITCYLAYLTAEIFHLSGIIAIVFAGFTMNSYVEHNISQKSHTTVKYSMKMLANICETIIFMLLGISAVSDFWQHWNTGFVLWTLVFITIYRAIGVVGLTYILNKFRLDRINGVDQFVMAYGGLRGAIAFSLVSLTSHEVVPAIKTMICACIVCILFTSFVQGSTIRPIVEYLQVQTANEHRVNMFEDINMRLIDHLMAGIEDVIGHRGHHYWTQRLIRLNTEYLMKWFVREPFKTHDQVLLDTFHRINKREAQDMLLEIERGGSSSELTSERTLANLLLPTEMRRSFSTASFSSMLKTSSDACIDLRAIEMQRQSANRPTTNEDEMLGDAHHLLKENMYRPRVKMDVRYRRGEIDVSHSQKRQEQEILIRRRIHQRRKKSQKSKNHRKHSKTFGPQTHRSRNGSYITTPQPTRQHTEPVCLMKQTINPLTGLVAPSVMIEGCYHDSSGAATPVIEEAEPEDEGITFTVDKKESEVIEPEPKTEVKENRNSVVDIKPVALEKELPWRTTNQEPEDEPEAVTNRHSVIDLKPVLLDKELPWRAANPAVGICDPRERRGSVHPHYYEEFDDEDAEAKPGTSNNTNTNNSNDAAGTDAKRVSVKSDTYLPSKKDGQSQLTPVSASTPLLVQHVDSFDLFETLPEDSV